MALDEKAEIIRRGIEALPPALLPRLPPPIPKELLAKIGTYTQDRRAFDAERRAGITAGEYRSGRANRPRLANP